jgi:superfamily I DNA/RNA helicase
MLIYKFLIFRGAHKFFLNTRDEVLIVCDKRQNIFDRELDWLDKRVNREGLDKFEEPYIDLTITFRLPKRVAVMSNEFSVNFDLNQELKVGKIEDNPILLHSDHIIWLNIDENDWQYFIYNAFLRLKKAGYSASDMVILLPNHKLGKEAIALFKAKQIEVNHVFEEDTEAKYHTHKKAFWMGDGRLKMSTIHSFKGWELLNIIIFIPARAPETNKKLDALVYTALTRTRENLIILNANNRYNNFGEKLPKKWNEQ